MSLAAVKNEDGTVFKQIKRTQYKAEEVSRYPNSSLNAVVGRMGGIYSTNKRWVFKK